MGADHDRLDALRRLARDRAATPAEKSAARRMAKALAAKIGNRPRRGRRKGPDVALPEPPAARWRRRWVVRLGAVLDKIEVAWKWLPWVQAVSIITLLPITVFSGEALPRWATYICVGLLLAAGASNFVMIAVLWLLAFAVWLLETWRGERLRPALIFIAEQLPWFAMIAAYVALRACLGDHLGWLILPAIAAAWLVMFAINIAWWRWVYPAIESALMRASRGALRTGILVLAIGVSLAAGGVWVAVYAR